MNLPNHIFFTGAPGSSWSFISQVLETIPSMNTSDRNPNREYHPSFRKVGHVGAYFGRGMEFEATIDLNYINQAWTEAGGTRIVKSHDWAYKLQEIKNTYPDAWIMMVYRPDMSSFAWWHQAGGFEIEYPCYDAYQNSIKMLAEIQEQNKCLLEFGMQNKCQWEYFTSEWIADNFSADITVPKTGLDILVTLVK
jgi:hypothetical protein